MFLGFRVQDLGFWAFGSGFRANLPASQNRQALQV